VSDGTVSHVNSLQELIGQEIISTGPITFARFMEIALYHPLLGYYAGGGQGREPVGWSGDYFTSGDLHPLWGWTIARQLYQMWELLGQPTRFEVVEPGAARGMLARDIWHFASECVPAWTRSLTYTLVDRASPESSLYNRRIERLHSELQTLNVPDQAVRVVGADALTSLPEEFTGCVVSNEVVDALPVHILEKQEDGLAEVYVGLDPATGRFSELLGPPSSVELAGYLDRTGVPWRDYPATWRCEVRLGISRWLQEATDRLRQGYVLTIDYGDLAAKLYTPARVRGTLAVYQHHQMGGSPLAQPGRQDITAQVNFTSLIDAGHALGFDTIGLTTQEQFLRRLGIQEEARDLASRLYPAADSERHTDRGQADYLRRASLLSAVSTLLDPGGLGAFRVLAQQRGVPESAQSLLGIAGDYIPGSGPTAELPSLK
jgi:SAM-dependent MidA family methyltransferase